VTYHGFRRRYVHDATGRAAPAPRIDPPEGAGIVYLAVGDEHVALAAVSVAQVRKVGYRGPIRIVTDATTWPGGDPEVELVTVSGDVRWVAPRHHKTTIFDHAYPITLFLDADVIPIAAIDAIWQQLEDAEVALAEELSSVQGFIDYYWDKPESSRLELAHMLQLGLATRPFYNSGVILFRRTDAVAGLFRAWHDEWRRFGQWDQPALVRALARTDLAVRTLPKVWNSPPTWFGSIPDARCAGVKLLHFFSGPQRERLPGMLGEPSAPAPRGTEGR
jgi:hypothetical protein